MENQVKDFAALSPGQMAAFMTSRWKTIALCAGLGFLLSVVYLHVARQTYTIQLLVGPTEGGRASEKLQGLGGLAAAAGISMPENQNTSKFDLYLEGMFSRSVADALAKDSGIMRNAFHQQWDTRSQSWHKPSGVLSTSITAIKILLGIPVREWHPPDGADMDDYIKKNVILVQVPKDVLATITMTSEDPQFGKSFLLALHQATDNQLRQKALTRSALYIKYLSEKLETVTVAEHRQALTQTLTEQEQSMMMASSNVAFAAEPFGGPSASAKPTSPIPLLALSLGTLLGALFGIVWVVASDRYELSINRIARRLWATC